MVRVINMSQFETRGILTPSHLDVEDFLEPYQEEIKVQEELKWVPKAIKLSPKNKEVQ